MPLVAPVTRNVGVVVGSPPGKASFRLFHHGNPTSSPVAEPDKLKGVGDHGSQPLIGNEVSGTLDEHSLHVVRISLTHSNRLVRL
jgi:hypothetical protein